MKNSKLLFLLAAILVLFFWKWFVPGPRVATDFSSISDSLLKSLMDFPYVWMEKPSVGLGEYTIFTLWSYPINFISGVLANLGLGFVIQERILYLIPFLAIGAFGFWRFCQTFNISGYSRYFATLFYFANTYILLLIDGGQLNVALAYAFFPISFLAIEQSIKDNLRSKVLAGFAVSLLGFFDIRFIYVLLILTGAKFLYHPGAIFAWVKSGLIITIIVLGLNAYWLLPYIKQPLASEVYAKLTESSFTSFSNLGHGVLMLSPHWFKNVFGEISPLRWEFMLIPILVFLAPILRPKNYWVGFWLTVALISIFLTKGAALPFPDVYPWLYHNIPGFSLFRDPSKFFFLVALSYSALLGVTFDELTKRIRAVRVRYLFLLFSFLYLIFLIRPVWSGKMTGTFSDPPFQKAYSELAQILETDNEYSRIFWIPTIAPLANLTNKHPSVEASRLVQKRPFAIGTIGTYEIFNFLREAPYMGEIFDVSGIGYIVYPYLDARRDDMHPDNIKYYYVFGDQLSKLPWLLKVNDSPIPLWKTKQHQDKFFTTPNVWWVVGSDNIYSAAAKNAQLKLSKNALIFVEEQAGLGQRIEEIPQAKIVLSSKTTLDLAASFIDSSNLIFPAKNLRVDPVESGWWKREAKDLIRWRDFLQTKYGIDNLDFDLGGGWAVGEGELELRIKNKELRENRILLARVLESTRSGRLRFYQDDDLIGEIHTKKEGNNVRWFEVGQLPKDGEELEVRSSGDINVVNALAILDKQEWIGFQKKANSFSNRVVDFNKENTHEINTTLTYQQINPTKYKVYIRNLTEPTFLVFSQTFDKNWNMSGQRSLPAYSLLNGFRVEKDGEYLVEFEVQKYVYPGILISGLTLFTALFILISSHLKAKS